MSNPQDMPTWTRAPMYPAGYAPEFAYADVPAIPIQWCALADAPKTASWGRTATCYLAKPGVDTNKPTWDPNDYVSITDKATCQKYMLNMSTPVAAFQRGSSTPVTYKPVADGTSYWPQVKYNHDPVNQCASVLSVDAWAAGK